MIAFFDVDEALLTTPVRYDFLRYRLGESQYAYEADQLGALTALGIDPPDLLRAYYRLYTGTLLTELMEQGRHWYEEVRAGRRIGPPFITQTLTALRAHQAAGHLTALVSEAFAPCLAPLRGDLGADLVVSTDPVLNAEGRLTGEVRHPMTAAAKARAVVRAAAEHCADLRDCFGYGTRTDGLGVLAPVGNPTVVDARTAQVSLV
ncbi:HAD-IB family hydrolase [Streptomyces coacervatus]|uniref:HAD-IB family hydrolase n=1 Tax=Streptomyces coacervatus TaxID=647381 RepID=A0ABP7H7Q1_9ACTN|nr:haloacid dehalogenase-like hydrolase [Streptomyces coacervatus]MDF2267517.1 haloacid dehalogenase-like hydrolase [Streptomyces coacervatus]